MIYELICNKLHFVPFVLFLGDILNLKARERAHALSSIFSNFANIYKIEESPTEVLLKLKRQRQVREDENMSFLRREKEIVKQGNTELLPPLLLKPLKFANKRRSKVNIMHFPYYLQDLLSMYFLYCLWKKLWSIEWFFLEGSKNECGIGKRFILNESIKIYFLSTLNLMVLNYYFLSLNVCYLGPILIWWDKSIRKDETRN